MPSPRTLAVLASAALALSTAVAPSNATDVGVGGFMSPNVTWVASIPLDTPGIGGRVLTVGGQRRFYVTGLRGLTIYDVTIPYLPVPLGHLELPHFENESVAVSDDGSVVIIAVDSLGAPGVTYVIDTSLVNAPLVKSVIPEGSHTATCANAACTHVYGNYGWTYDITNRANPVKVTNATYFGASHYIARDSAGFLSDGVGNMWDARTNPARPTRRTVGTRGWHNSLRPNASAWVARSAGDTGGGLRAGELHIGGDETWLAPGTCNASSAAVTTWDMRDWEKGRQATIVSTIRPRNGNWVDGNPAVDGVGCSSHWFDYRGGMVAAGWYDHGVRFIKVNETTGVATEWGYFQPVDSMAWGAYWIDDEYVYSVDGTRGIDILKVNRSAPAAPLGDLVESWRPVTFSSGAREIAAREVYFCRKQATRTT